MLLYQYLFSFISLSYNKSKKGQPNLFKNIYKVHRSNLIHSPFQPVKLFVSKETILKLLNIDFMKVNQDDDIQVLFKQDDEHVNKIGDSWWL